MNGHHNTTKIPSSSPPKKILLNKGLACKILQQLNECRLEQQFTDAILSVDQEELHCHRCVLAASSPYFKATFSSSFQEAIDSRVVLRDVSPWIMKRILEYIYSGQLEITLDTAIDYLRTGHLLHYPDIVDACCELLSTHLHPSNCLGIKELASLYNCASLETQAYNYTLEHFTLVVEKSEELAELSVTSLVTYLSADNADICNEAIMWKALRQWIHFDVENRKQYLYELLSCVRLPVLTSKELNLISNEPMVRSQPKCAQLLEKALSVSHEDIITSVPLQSDHILKQKVARPSTLPRDMIVLFGGSSDYELTQMVSYDPLKCRWLYLPSLPESIVRASITAHDDTIFITGGIVNNELSNTMWIFCCKEKRWTKGKCLLKARAKHSSVLMNGCLYLSGGVRLDEEQTVVPMNEIHSYDIQTGVWKRVGYNNAPKQDGTLLGINGTLYELGGQSDGRYTSTMETYKLTTAGMVTRTDEHYVLPCTGDPGPLRAASHEKDFMIILWENTGHLFSLNTNGGRFYPVNHTLSNLSGCLVAFNRHAYILGGVEDGKPCTEGKVLDLVADSYTRITIPSGLVVHKCVHVRM